MGGVRRTTAFAALGAILAPWVTMAGLVVHVIVDHHHDHEAEPLEITDQRVSPRGLSVETARHEHVLVQAVPDAITRRAHTLAFAAEFLPSPGIPKLIAPAITTGSVASHGPDPPAPAPHQSVLRL